MIFRVPVFWKGYPMKNLIRDLAGIVGAFIAWWSLAVLVGMVIYSIWPATESSFTAGLSLEPQNIPGNLAGFILALYIFRRMTSGSSYSGSSNKKNL